MLPLCIGISQQVFYHISRHIEKGGGMPTLTQRKLIKFGDGGLVITVPKAWIRYYGLKVGDKLEVIADGELIIRPVKETLSSSRQQKPKL